jgi:chemotaxis protein CheX
VKDNPLQIDPVFLAFQLKQIKEWGRSMNVNFLNPFVNAAFEVIHTETNITAERGDLSLERVPYRTEDITVVIGLVGAVEGTVFYSMNIQTALCLVGKMLGDEVREMNQLAQSGISELANVITGRASVLLSESGYEATISPPALIIGKDAIISTLDFPRLVVPLILDKGALKIHLALREGSNKKLKTSEIPVPTTPQIL